LKERAFAEYERRGLPAEAAGLARWLAFLHVSVNGNPAAANGWMARAESLLEDRDRGSAATDEIGAAVRSYRTTPSQPHSRSST
jgi:hypothetical protein